MVDARHRRAVAVIAVSAAALAVAGALYLAPSIHLAPPARPSAARPPVFTVAGEAVSFAFVTPNAGWAAVTMDGDSAISVYATTDGARSWSQVGAVQTPEQVIHVDVRVFDVRRGEISAYSETGVLEYRTADGGRSWTAIELEPATWWVEFADPNRGWSASVDPVSSATHLFSTGDGGSTWQPLPDPPAPGYPDFATAGEGWLGGPASTRTVYSTDDGGETWRASELPVATCAPGDKSCGFGALQGSIGVTALGGRAAIALDGAGVEFVTLDGGASWRLVPPPPGLGDYADISYADATNWWVIRGSGLYKTSDAGATWTQVSMRIEYDALKPTIIDSQHAWAMVQGQPDTQVGQRPQIGWSLETTSDGGLTWKDAAVPVPH